VKTRFRSKQTALLGIALSAMMALAGCSAIAELGPMAAAGDTFMKDMKAADHDASFKMLAEPLQKELGGQEGWDKFAEPRVPTEWNFTSKNISSGKGTLVGTATFANGQHLNVSLTLTKEGDAWKVIGFDFKA
jgi:hypothetical protein